MKTYHVVIAVLVVVIAYYIFFPNHVEVPYEVVVSDTIYVPDSVLVPYRVEVIKPQKIDTMAVIEDYFTKKDYEIPIQLGEYGVADIRFTLHQNVLDSFNYNYRLDIPKPIRYKNTISLQRSVLYNTYQLNYQREITKRITLNTSVTTKGDLLLGVGYKF